MNRCRGWMTLRWWPLSVAGATALLLASLLAPLAHSQPATLKIVSSLPRTGNTRPFTDSIVNAIRMALAESDNAVDGITIEYEDLDDATLARGAWDARQEAANALSAIEDPSVVAYIGTYNSGAAKVAIPLLCSASLAMISPGNTYPGLTKQVIGVEANEPDVYYPGCPRNYTRVVPADDVQGVVAANWAKQLGVTSVYVLDDTELYGHGLASAFSQTAQRIGLLVVGGPEGIDSRATTYQDLAEKISASGADLVYFGGITQSNAGKLWQDLRAVLGPEVKLMGPDGIYESAFVRDAGEAANGTYITFGGVAPSQLTDAGAAWYEAYKARYGSEPEAYAGYGYEATRVVLDAIHRAPVKDRPSIRDALFATQNYAGILGTWSFDANGDTTLTRISGRQIVDGQFDDANAVVISADAEP